MNPLSLLLLGLGIILVVIGFKGSQSKVLAALKGVPQVAKGQKVTATVNSSAVNAGANPNVQAV